MESNISQPERKDHPPTTSASILAQISAFVDAKNADLQYPTWTYTCAACHKKLLVPFDPAEHQEATCPHCMDYPEPEETLDNLSENLRRIASNKITRKLICDFLRVRNSSTGQDDEPPESQPESQPDSQSNSHIWNWRCPTKDCGKELVLPYDPMGFRPLCPKCKRTKGIEDTLEDVGKGLRREPQSDMYRRLGYKLTGNI
ncbi:hypothetical protein B0J14DRAFT_655636 [Halenospora varia]|nr:hypothetical protein B0J14DRAFT_655636 [Halenospora varia]